MHTYACAHTPTPWGTCGHSTRNALFPPLPQPRGPGRDWSVGAELLLLEEAGGAMAEEEEEGDLPGPSHPTLSAPRCSPSRQRPPARAVRSRLPPAPAPRTLTGVLQLQRDVPGSPSPVAAAHLRPGREVFQEIQLAERKRVVRGTGLHGRAVVLYAVIAEEESRLPCNARPSPAFAWEPRHGARAALSPCSYPFPCSGPAGAVSWSPALPASSGSMRGGCSLWDGVGC